MVEEVYGKGFNISNDLSVPYVDLNMNTKKQKRHDHLYENTSTNSSPSKTQNCTKPDVPVDRGYFTEISRLSHRQIIMRM